MLDKLKKLLEGGIAQANIFDGGKTYQSVVNNRTPQQQNAVQQQQLQARQFNAARPQQAPQQNFTDKLRDILDANSQADKFRRAQVGQATSYQEQQAKNPNAYNQVTGMASKITNTGPVGLFNDVRSKGFGTLVNPNDLIRRGNPFAGAADVARQESNKLVQQNPAILNDPTTKSMYEMANTPRGLQDAAGRAITTVGNAPVIRDIKEAPGINVLNDMLISPILRTTANSLARVGSAGSGNQSYSTGVKGAAELGSDIYNVATMAYAPAASKVLSQGGQAALRAIPGAASRGFLAGSGANVQQQLADGANPDDISLQDAALSGGLGGIVNAGLPIAGGATSRQLGKGFDALGNLIRKPRSVAEITQEVATARQPAIANNAPRTRVAPDGTSLPPRSASQIAQELADSKARAVDPAVQARRTVMNTPNDGLAHVTTPGSALGILDDGKIRANPIGEQGGAKGVSMGTNYTGRNGETLNWADQFAEPGQPKVKINIDRTKLNAKQLLQNDMELTHTGDVPLSAIKSIETDSPKVAAEYRAKGVPVIDTNAKRPRATLQTAPKQDPLEALKAEARKYKSADEFVNSQVSRPKTTDNVWQDTLPSGTRPDSIKKVTKSGGNPLYHDTTADGVLGILDSGEIKASQAPFSSIAGQGKRVSTTRNFDNYSRYNKSPYRLVIDESKTGQRAIPDNREEFESIFRKGVSTKAVNSVAIDTTNPALLDDIRSGKLKSVIESAKKKGITVEPFEGKVLPNEGANAEVQTMTSRAFNEAFPEYKTRISQLTDLYNQATKPKAYYQNVPKSYTEPRAKSEVELNTKRLNLTPEQASQLDPKVKSVVDRMSNDDVVRIAKSAGLDTKSYSPGETRVKIAEQLNVRQDAVRLMNEAEVARKAGNTDQAAELLKQAAEQGRISRTQGTDLARQLQARRIIANELDTPQQKVFKLFDEAGVNPDVYTKRLAGVDFSDSKQVVNAYRELVPAKAGQWLDTVRYNSMLSSPLTQAVNIFGNAQNVAGVAPIEKTIRGGIDSIAGLFGKERQYAAGEGASYLKGEVKALPKAAKSFVDALKGSGEYANQDFSDYNMPLATKGAAGKAYQALSFPMRVLDGMDKFFRTLASSGEEAALDKRVSKGIGLRGDKQSLIDQEAAYRVYQAEGHIPGQGKVLDAMDSVADLVMSGRNSKNPILSTISKFTVPFVKTVNNINKQGFIEYSPAGLLNLVGKEDKIDGITKAVMGTAVFGTSALLLKSGDMTWAEPRNAEERARFRAEGKQPYAIKMGDKWYNYSKLTPVVAFPMAMTAALDDAFNKGKADQSFIDKTLTAFAKYGNFMSDQSYAKSIGDTLGAIGGDEEAIARMVSNQWQQVVPARALTGWLARMTDDVERKVDTTQGYFDQQVQAFMQQYPGLRQKTPTRDYQGQPIAANNQVLNAFSPVRVTNDRGVSPLDAEQDAIKLATDKAELLDKRQLKEVDNRSADKIREAQKQLISQPGWNELTAEEKKSGLSRLESDIKAVEKLQYQADNHVGEYSGSYTGKSTKLTANQKTLVNDGVKLSKYVGKSDSTEAKTNKEKYEKAFEDFNDPDNGYSRVEKVKKREELKRLTVQKDYDEDTTMLHGMSKEDVWGFLSTYEDGKAMADKLLALDDALTAAGVQDKNKFRDKYGNITIKPKEKSSGGSKAKTVKGQAEAVSSERKLRALLANTNNKASYRKPATQSAKVGLKKFAVKSAGLTSKKGA